MKQKDILLIVVIVIVSAVLSFVVSSKLFGGTKSGHQKVPVVGKIVSSFPEPDKNYFNKDAFDPTQIITIGQNANPDPFKDSGN